MVPSLHTTNTALSTSLRLSPTEQPASNASVSCTSQEIATYPFPPKACKASHNYPDDKHLLAEPSVHSDPSPASCFQRIHRKHIPVPSVPPFISVYRSTTTEAENLVTTLYPSFFPQRRTHLPIPLTTQSLSPHSPPSQPFFGVRPGPPCNPFNLIACTATPLLNFRISIACR